MIKRIVPVVLGMIFVLAGVNFLPGHVIAQSQFVKFELPNTELPPRLPADVPRERTGDVITQNYYLYRVTDPPNSTAQQSTRVFTTALSLSAQFSIYLNYFQARRWAILATLVTQNLQAIAAQKDDLIFTLNLSMNTVTGVKTVDLTVSWTGRSPNRPTGLKATVGNNSVLLTWDPVPSPVFDGFNIQVARIDNGIPIDLGNVNPSGILIRQNRFLVTSFANGQFPQNGKLYRFRIKGVKNGTESAPSDPIFAKPGSFVASSRPPQPVLFLHGINSDAGTWDDTKNYLIQTLGWRFGGQLFNNGDTIASQFENGFSRSDGDFFTASFGNNLANYSDNQGIIHQGREVDNFLQKLNSIGATGSKIIVAHSMGGLASRSFLADFPSSGSRVSHLITYGTPHRGASFAHLAVTDGVRDMEFDCTLGQLSFSPFLTTLSFKTLPNITYTSIIGNTSSRIGGCLSSRWDNIVPTDSANLRLVPPITSGRLREFTTNRAHTQMTNDVSSILCALDPNCMQVQVFSPVDIEVVAPNQNSITRDIAGIAGASYMEPEDPNDHLPATVLIPFPQSGHYMIKPTPKPGALPTDTFTITLTVNGVTTVLAQDVPVQSIPPTGYPVEVVVPEAFDICLQDDTGTHTLNINSATGDYKFTRCSDGLIILGKGTLSKRGCDLTLSDIRTDRRMQATYNSCGNKGSASLQLFSLGATLTIIDKNTTNNTCICGV